MAIDTDMKHNDMVLVSGERRAGNLRSQKRERLLDVFGKRWKKVIAILP